MKNTYEKPQVYSEKLAIDTLRAQCCPSVTNTSFGMTVAFTPQCTFGQACGCTEVSGSS